MTSPSTILQKSLLNSPLTPILPAPKGAQIGWFGLCGSARSLAIAAAATKAPGPILVITASVNAARQLEDEIRFYADDPSLPLLLFPDRECLPYDALSPHQDITAQRLETLYRLPQLARGLVLAPAPTLLHRLPPREFIASQSFMLSVGEVLDIPRLREQLVHAAYHSVSQVMEPGEFAVRGGLIDLFPVGSPAPFRIDLFGERVESIREFDAGTQRSGKTLKAIRLLPAREFPLTQPAIHRFRAAFRSRFEGDPQKVSIYRDVTKGLSPAGSEYYLPLFFDRTETFFSYLPDAATLFLDAGVSEAMDKFQHEVQVRYNDLHYDRERPLLAPAELFLDATQFLTAIGPYSGIHLLGPQAAENPSAAAEVRTETAMPVITYDTRPPVSLPVDHKSEAPYGALFDYLRGYPGRTLLVAETAGRRETLLGLLKDNGFSPKLLPGWQTFLPESAKLCLTVADLERGLLLNDPALTVITEPQLYGERAAQRRRRIAAAARDPQAIIRSLAELHVGAPVVHEDHGVGRYLGLQTLDVGDGPVEFLALEYAGGDKLYIPVLSLQLIHRYTGTDPEHAPLHRLGGDAWEKAKRRAREKAYDAAAELLEIYALRAARRGRAFPVHEQHYQAFADAFPFEETPDQTRAIGEVLKDMESDNPMDRLVCGDVGFGKTEVAMRAAFLAVYGRAQVAVLVPTTLLAQQHFQNFRDRFAGLPFRIELLSRFRTKAEQEEVVRDLADGRVDIVIGTHRLLQEDVRFKNLGLAILDEEHRFGVRQKERLKKLRSEVDILTLTATPIPRTLNLALSGLREISVIATAPEGRLAVKTVVSEWNKALIREACLREIRRGGQVYYLHNEVRTIDRAARELTELLPEAEIHVAHGQMPERELERIMLDFYHQRFNILICSTIIESGIDVPTANTIVIERADKLGLAQLHQLRGRVGRSHARAYAYLLVPPRSQMTEEARKRLEAIAALEELGAGFTLASHDLEIRGAGELLGESQSGLIDEVGFAMYAELLERAVRSLRAGGRPELEAPAPLGAEVNLHAPALLPEDYLPDVHQRLVLYKRIAGTEDLQALQGLREEIIDRFGVLPAPATLLFKAAELKILASPLGIRKIDAGPRGARIEFTEKPNIDPTAIIRLLQSVPRTYKLDGPNRLRILGEMPDVESRIKRVRELLNGLM